MNSSLNKQGGKALARARKKMEKINTDVLNSRGLTVLEAAVAAKKDLIDSDQIYWWLEKNQKRHRRAEKDIIEGRTHTFANAVALLDGLS